MTTTVYQSGNVAGLLLAGGEGRRLGGRDKGMVPWQGRPMAGWVYDALTAVVNPVLISANRSLDDYRALAPGLVCPDPDHIRGQGPLAGLLTGMLAARALGAVAVLVCPCDTPGITPQVLQTLLTTWRDSPEVAVIAESDGRQHPLHGVYPVAFADSLAAQLAAGNRRVMEFARATGARVVALPGAHGVFANRNLPADVDGSPKPGL